MARVTVEDCLKNVKNRFELVLIAAKRTRQLMHGKDAKVDWDNDKPTVVALREIAAGYTEFGITDEQANLDVIAATFPAATLAAAEEDEEVIEHDHPAIEPKVKEEASQPPVDEE